METADLPSPFLSSPSCDNFNRTFSIEPEAAGKTIARLRAPRQNHECPKIKITKTFSSSSLESEGLKTKNKFQSLQIHASK